MLPVNRSEDYLSLVKQQSLERLKAVEEALRAEATAKQQSYEFNYNICTQNASEEDKPLLPTMCDFLLTGHNTVSSVHVKRNCTVP